MKKILISDYDDTFFTDDVSIVKNVSEVNEFRKNGNLFVIATSRSWKSISEELEKYNIICDYVICNVGGVIINPKEKKHIYANFLDFDIAEQIEEILKDEKNIEVTRFGLNEEKYNLKELLGYKIEGDENSLKKIKSILKENNLDLGINYYSLNKLFINGINTKEAAIEKLCEIIGKNVYIITVGDENVDIGMVKKYNGYRMKNCSEAMKNATNKVVENVYDILEKLVKAEK